jgi:RNA polymerase sigma factor (sigma-70 family)
VAAVRTDGIADDPRSRVAAVVARHERALLRVARLASLCHDDALDAYQRALEIFVRRVETVDPATEVAWLKVVIRHEAMAIRRARSESVTGEELDLDSFIPGSDRSVEDQIASGERVRRSAEALRALKPDEAKALMMKAHGLSYEEIGKRNGWTYTKVNRAITEGRRRFMRVYEGIESGQECERFGPIVEALAGGTATAAQVLAIRPHLRHCTVCRAAVRDLHLSRLRRASLFWPIFIVAEPLGRLTTSSPSVEERLQELAGQTAVPPAPDVAVPLPEIIDGGLQLPLHLPAPPPPETVDAGRLGGVRHNISEFFHRANATDLATGVQIAVSGGGGRVATVAAVLGLCLSGAGIGTVCVVSGLVTDPLGIMRKETPPAKPLRHVARAPVRAPAVTTTIAVARATSTPQPRAHRHQRSPSAAKDPSQGTTRTSHEHAPISPAPASSTGQEAFTPEVAQAPSKPAAAPATGGAEFTP